MVNFSSSFEYRAAKSGRQAAAERRCCVSQGVERRELLLAAFGGTRRLGFCLGRRLCFILRRDFDQLGLKLLHCRFEGAKLSIGSAEIAAAAHCFEVFGGGDGGLGAEDCSGALQGVSCGVEFRSILRCECGTNGGEPFGRVSEEGFRQRLDQLFISAGRAEKMRSDILDGIGAGDCAASTVRQSVLLLLKAEPALGMLESLECRRQEIQSCQRARAFRTALERSRPCRLRRAAVYLLRDVSGERDDQLMLSGDFSFWRIARVASRPSMRGICSSISTMSY